MKHTHCTYQVAVIAKDKTNRKKNLRLFGKKSSMLVKSAKRRSFFQIFFGVSNMRFQIFFPNNASLLDTFPKAQLWLRLSCEQLLFSHLSTEVTLSLLVPSLSRTLLGLENSCCMNVV